jgi:hypothetical protein
LINSLKVKDIGRGENRKRETKRSNERRFLKNIQK